MSKYYVVIDHTAPEVLSLDDAKKQLKMEDLGTFDDAIIQDCIDAAIDEAESYINAHIREAKYSLKANTWPAQDYEFRKQKIQSIDAIASINPAGETVIVETIAEFVELLPVDKYASIIHYIDADNLPDLITTKTNAVTINITCGYVTGQVPKGLLQAVKLLVTENYNIRNNIESKDYKSAAYRKLEPYKYYT